MQLRERATALASSAEARIERLRAQHEAITERDSLNAILRRYPDRMETTEAGPLSGLGYVVKDVFEVRGAPVSLGLEPPAIAAVARDAAAVRFFDRLGATLLGSTNLDPACLGYTGKNPFFGTVCNPHDARLMCGGSSSGSAAAVVAGLADFALGTDAGGSVRIPAAMTGITGLRTTPGLVDASGAFLVSERFDSIGILAHTADDLEFLLDHTAADKAASPIRKLFVLNSEDLQLTSSEIRSFYLDSLEPIREAFELISLPASLSFAQLHTAWKILAAHDIWDRLERLLGSQRLRDIEQGEALFRFIGSLPKDARTGSHQIVMQVRQSFLRALDTYAILTPTLPVPIPVLDSFDDHTVPLNIFASTANLFELPAITIPVSSGEVGNSLSNSLQLIGAAFTDKGLVRAGRQIHLVLSRG